MKTTTTDGRDEGIPIGVVQRIGPTQRYGGLGFIWLNTRFPCCRTRSRVRAIDYVPVEEYARTCPNCLAKWIVKRSILKRDNGLVRIDLLDWECSRVGK